MGKIKLIFDSMADLTKDQIEKYDIEFLPLNVILDDKEYKDGIDFELDEFYQLLKDKKYPKTSQVTYGQFKTAFDKYVADGRTIFYIASSANATGSYQSAVMAKNDTEGDIHLYDASNLTFGAGMFVLKAAQLLEEGNDIALVSDAGYPAISDPGYELVKEAIEHEINVVPISGCNACLDALVVSGIAPQPFMFYGFLDHLDKKKKKELIDLKKYKETIVFYESPHRIKKTLNLMLDILGDRNIALCREITKKHEEIIRGHISEIISIVEELKGEMVIVVEGSQEVEEEITFETTIKEDVDMYIEKGMSTKDAIKEVAKQRNLNKNSVYQEYHSK